MANFASSSSSPLISPPVFAESSAAIAFPCGDDDLQEDCCSICLELFNSSDPATVTNCKHDYHLHCILEWSQRSKECPICWQSLSLNDPASQELLSAVETERRLRSRNTNSVAAPTAFYYRQMGNSDNESSDEFNLDDRIMQHLAMSASIARLRGRERHRYSGLFRPDEILHSSPVNSDDQGYETPLDESCDSSPEPFSSGSPPVLNGEPSLHATPSTDVESRVAFKPRVVYRQFPSAGPLRPSPEITFSESIKSKWSSASARYKESFSRGTKGLKEKILARNNSVKELSKEVSAGVVKMIERLDLASKKIETREPGVSASLSSKGKGVLDAALVQSLCKNAAKVHEVGSVITIPGRVEVSRPQVFINPKP